MRIFLLYVLIILLDTAPHLFAGEVTYFRNISTLDGLSNLNVKAVCQDNTGYIWVATMRGLNRFNGYEFQHYFHDPKDPNSLLMDAVHSLYFSDQGYLYVGSPMGLVRYDPRLDKMTRLFEGHLYPIHEITGSNGTIYINTTVRGLFRFHEEDMQLERIGENLKPGSRIGAIYIDNNDNLWIGSQSGKGLARYNSDTNHLEYFACDRVGEEGCSRIQTIYELTDQILAIGTTEGLMFFDKSKEVFIAPEQYKKLGLLLQGTEINLIFEYPDGKIYAGTTHKGLFSFDKHTGVVTHYCRSNDQIPEEYSVTYNAYHIDKTGNLWLGTFENGLKVAFSQLKRFNFDSSLNQLTKRYFVTHITQDKLGRLVISTRNNGFIVYNPEDKSSRHFFPEPHSTQTGVRSLFVDSYNRYWIGTGGSLLVFDPLTESFFNTDRDLLMAPDNFVSFAEIEGKVIAGTASQGIWVFDMQATPLFRTTSSGRNIPCVIPLNRHEVVFLDYRNGLHVMNVIDYSVRKIDLPSLQNQSSMLVIHIDQDGVFWIGTYGSGLIRFDPQSDLVAQFGIDDGMPSNDVVSIEEDTLGNLWLGTSYGLVRFGKYDESIRVYSHKEGLNNYQFHEKASMIDKNGVIYFGGNFGLTYFNPEDMVTTKSKAPEVILKDLYVNNKRVSPSLHSHIISESVAYASQITLTHRERNFSLEYAAFDYLDPDAMRYSYKMKGLDKEWNDAGSLRRISYTNLRRGNYMFKVKARNHEGVLSETPATIAIKVIPAPWFSAGAWTAYGFFILTIAFVLFRLSIKTVVAEKRFEMEQMEHKREREVNDMKKRFFSNIAHEFRTPLTLLGATFKQMEKLDDMPAAFSEYNQIARFNVKRLLKLVNQLLAYKMIEGEVMNLWLKKDNLNEVVKRIVRNFEPLAQDKSIVLSFADDEKDYDLFFDADIIEKILNNLLSNAIKHTPRSGRVDVHVNRINGTSLEPCYFTDDNNLNFDGNGTNAVAIFPELRSEYVEISVIDNGRGISPENLHLIFQRYKTGVDNSDISNKDYGSTGIGLDFTKKMVALHQGFIKVSSRQDEGTVFSFVIPVDANAYPPSSFVAQNPEINDETPVEIAQPPGNPVIQSDFKKKVLIVEDDPQLNAYLKNVLKQYYHVKTAYNGKEALSLIKKEEPDMVVSDIVMPGMNGLELLSFIKQSEELSHVLFVVLSSKSEISEQIEGLRLGADCYIPKPFDVDYLLHRIDNLFDNRQRIQNIFGKGAMPEIKDFDDNPALRKFLTTLHALIEKNLSNTELDISFIAGEMNMSRSGFYRKFMCLTKLTPVAYIKKYRINKAIILMHEKEMSFRDISDAVGFGSPAYFSTAFKQEMNMTPSEYVKKLSSAIKDSVSPPNG